MLIHRFRSGVAASIENVPPPAGNHCSAHAHAWIENFCGPAWLGMKGVLARGGRNLPDISRPLVDAPAIPG
jgi:hypothetical protein